MNEAESKSSTIVLGSGVTEKNRPGYDGKLRSLALIELIKTNPNRIVIFSGGKTAGTEYFSEAESMRNYVFGKVDANVEMIIEDEALDTVDNLEKSFVLIRDRGISNIQIVTNKYHARRVKDVCARLKIQAEVIIAEDLVAKRSDNHEILIKNRDKSLEMRKRHLLERVSILLDKHFIGQRVMKVLAGASRGRR